MTDEEKRAMRTEFVKSALQGLLCNSNWMEHKRMLASSLYPADEEAAASWLKRELAEDAIEIADETVGWLWGENQ